MWICEASMLEIKKWNNGGRWWNVSGMVIGNFLKKLPTLTYLWGWGMELPNDGAPK